MKRSPATELQDLANDIASRAASLVSFRRTQGVEVAASKSAPEDIVTFADREAEQFIQEFLARERPLAGAVVNASNNELFSAAAGAGATLNGKRIAVRQNQDLSKALVATGFDNDINLRLRQAKIVSQLVQHVRDNRRTGSAALDLCSIAAGRPDLFYERGLHPWDQAAGELIAAEAGAVSKGLNGASAGYDFLLAGNPGLVAQVEPLPAEWSR